MLNWTECTVNMADHFGIQAWNSDIWYIIHKIIIPTLSEVICVFLLQEVENQGLRQAAKDDS
jgi:hypothetical protein